jgi:hypothetical protein
MNTQSENINEPQRHRGATAVDGFPGIKQVAYHREKVVKSVPLRVRHLLMVETPKTAPGRHLFPSITDLP